MTIPRRQEQHGTEEKHQHDHGHGHHHAHGHVGEGGKRGLLIALSITFLMMFAEIIGGLMANSLALLSDAGHMFTDTLALALSFFAMKFAEMPATGKKTFGFYRLEILAALLNGSILVLISFYIIYQAYLRILDPQPVEGGLMLIVAVIGLIVNITGALFLARFRSESLNIRGAFLHIIGDAVSSVGVIIGGFIITATGWFLIDPILSIAIALGIIAGAVGLLAESVNVLLESTPSHINIEAISEEIGRLEGVREAYHIHVWTITSGVYALSAHVVVDDLLVSRSRQLLTAIQDLLIRRFNVRHSTIQFECERCDPDTVCALPVDAGKDR